MFNTVIDYIKTLGMVLLNAYGRLLNGSLIKPNLSVLLAD
jgi:hypothetical protein